MREADMGDGTFLRMLGQSVRWGASRGWLVIDVWRGCPRLLNTHMMHDKACLDLDKMKGYSSLCNIFSSLNHFFNQSH